MTDDAIYLGSPGAITRLYWPSGGMDASRIRDVSQFVTGSGGMRVGKLLNATRTYTLDYAGLGRENFATLEAYDQGHMGPGPFVFLDPGRRNMLTVNQSSTTSSTNDTRDFTIAGSGATISSDATQVIKPPASPKCLRVSFSVSTPPAGVLLGLTKPSFWPGWPVVNRPYSFGFQCLGLVGSTQFNLTLTWYDLNGLVVSTSTGPLVTSSTAAWIEAAYENVSPPAAASFVVPGVDFVEASIAAGESLICSGFQMNEGANLDPLWSPGTGVYPVQVLSQREIIPFQAPEFRKANLLVLQELR